MTDRGMFFGLLVCLLIISTGACLTLIGSLVRPYYVAIRDRENGARTVIIRGTMRRLLIGLFKHVGLLGVLAPLVFDVRPPGWIRGLAFLVLVFGLMFSTASDMFDLRLLRYMLHPPEPGK